MRQDMELLTKVYKNSQTYSKTLCAIIDQIENKSLRQTLLGQIAELDSINRRAGEEITFLGEKPQKRINVRDKMHVWSKKMSVEIDPTLSNVAQIVSECSASGITDVTKAMNNCLNSSPKAYDLARRLVAAEERSRERVKYYL